MVTATASALHLVFRADSQTCALPLSQVVEILRPLSTEPLAGAPPFVRGISIIRGMPVPVVDLAAVLHGSFGPMARFVVVRAGERRFALAVEEVVGIREFRDVVWHDLPPLLSGARPGVIEAVAALDQEALLALKTGMLVPDTVWDLPTLQETR